jgi:ParB-like chromosome segregation protein Spo0J
LAVPVADLILDPANARRHPEKNLEAVVASLRVYKQRKPVVVNRRTGVVEAGNGTLEAAKALGWTHLAAVYVDDDPTTAAGFAIADNRSAELGEWDADALDRLLSEQDPEDEELRAMFEALAEEEGLASVGEETDEPAADQSDDLTESFQIIVTVPTEAEQAALLERLTGEGFQCRSLIS